MAVKPNLDALRANIKKTLKTLRNIGVSKHLKYTSTCTKCKLWNDGCRIHTQCIWRGPTTERDIRSDVH